MDKPLLLLLLLAVGTLAQNCDLCKPAVKIQNCYDPHCYRCDTNEVFNQATLYCDCIAGYYPINGFCGQCAAGYTYSAVLEECVGINPCGINQYLVNGTCQCLPGLIVIQNICQRCPTNQTYSAAFDACRCTAGYTLVNNSCIFITCGTNQVYSTNDQKCDCAFGYYLINGTCSQCANNQVYSAGNQSCTAVIPPLCGFNEYWYECCCFCQLGYIKISGVCSTCPQHSSYDYTTDSCVCDPGYYFVGEQVMEIPYQQEDTGSSFTSNPSYSYSYKSPYNGSPSDEPTIIVGSNYDSSGINTNGPNIDNVYNPPPVNRR